MPDYLVSIEEKEDAKKADVSCLELKYVVKPQPIFISPNVVADTLPVRDADCGFVLEAVKQHHGKFTYHAAPMHTPVEQEANCELMLEDVKSLFTRESREP